MFDARAAFVVWFSERKSVKKSEDVMSFRIKIKILYLPQLTNLICV